MLQCVVVLLQLLPEPAGEVLDELPGDAAGSRAARHRPFVGFGKQRLAGFMFYARDRKARGPQIGGPRTIWHWHHWLRPQCVLNGLAVNWSVNGKCKRGEPSQYSGEMMHVWLIEHPEGPFASAMYVSNDVLMRGLERRLEERGF